VKPAWGPRGVLVTFLILGGAGAALWVWTRPPRLGPLRATPADRRISVEVGEAVHFSAGAPGAVAFTWSIWGSAVSHLPTWTYVALPEDAGWQQVTLVVRGATGSTLARAWDLGVVPLVPPAVDVSPPPGHVVVPAGTRASFHCGARVAAARPSDHLWFEWTVDGRTMSRHEEPATEAVSEFLLPVPEAGSHRVVVRVTENERSSSVAEWVLESAPLPERPARPAEPGPAPPAQLVEAPPAPPPAQAAEARPAPVPEPPAHLAEARREPEVPAITVLPRHPRAPAASHVAGAVGERLRFATGIASDAPDASYDWSVDGRHVQGGATPTFDYTPETPGTHRVAVALRAQGTAVGADSWQVTARERRPVREEASASTARERAPVTGPGRVASVPTPTVPRIPEATMPRIEQGAATPAEVARAPRPGAALTEEEVHRWIDEYAHAWSRHDVDTLQRMGQVRSQADAERLTRYFGTVENLRVDVHVRAVRVDGERAAVEFERVDTMTDPGGRRQELRLPLQHKEIERTPEGLRFVN